MGYRSSSRLQSAKVKKFVKTVYQQFFVGSTFQKFKFKMDWYEGSIGEAIQCAKMSKSVFVVVIYGTDDDETSKKFLEVLNEADISSKLKKANAVSIKIQNGTESCTQFSQIYPVILVPSIYFIDSQSGTNIETTGGTVDKEKLIESIDKALEAHEKDPT